MRLRRISKKTFAQRLLGIALWWGIPMVCLELIGLPLRGWSYALIIVVPATLLGVVVYALLEHGIVRLFKEAQK